MLLNALVFRTLITKSINVRIKTSRYKAQEKFVSWSIKCTVLATPMLVKAHVQLTFDKANGDEFFNLFQEWFCPFFIHLSYFTEHYAKKLYTHCV